MKPERPRLLDALTQQFEFALSRFPRDSAGTMVPLAQADKLERTAARIARSFEEGTPQEPLAEQRLAALTRLRHGELALSPREWNHIAWGLCDDDGKHPKAIEDPALFEPLMSHTEGWITAEAVPRKPWFGLLHSYFAYHPEQPAGRGNWLHLRKRLSDTMPILVAGQRRPKLWSRLLEEHRDLLGDKPGATLRDVLFHGSAGDMDELNKGLPVADSSWLWQRVIAHQIAYLNGLSDKDFLQALPAMLTFLQGHPRHANDMLAALLTRYCQSGQRDEPHELLKNEAFTRWDNPQLVNASLWTMVEPPVRAMVLRWFAKQDLEHFFRLLQDAGQVDLDRFEFWYDYLDQMDYTRILLGRDALYSSRAEFQNFRDKNKGRFGGLAGGPGHNNAFIMRIRGHLFVEFSGKGNACYVYSEDQELFKLQADELHYDNDLKHKLRDPRTRQVNNRIPHTSGWQKSARLYLAERGIHRGASGMAAGPKVAPYQPKSNAAAAAPREQVTPPKQVPPPPSAAPAAASGAKPPSRVVRQARELARINGVPVEDNLDKGGLFWVLAPNPGPVLKRELLQIGLNFHALKGFWTK